MEFRIFSRNYYLKLRRLQPFSVALLVFFLFSCSTEEKKVESKIPKVFETVSFYPSGKPKEQTVFVKKNGKKEVFGFQELHENGQIKMGGQFDANGKRTGLWESFYEDGKPWSIGEYENGVEIGGKKTWYPNGKIRYQGQMRNGKPFGQWIFYDESGKKTNKTY